MAPPVDGRVASALLFLATILLPGTPPGGAPLITHPPPGTVSLSPRAVGFFLFTRGGIFGIGHPPAGAAGAPTFMAEAHALFRAGRSVSREQLVSANAVRRARWETCVPPAGGDCPTHPRVEGGTTGGLASVLFLFR